MRSLASERITYKLIKQIVITRKQGAHYSLGSGNGYTNCKLHFGL